jgi:hypothetical protein
MPAPTLPPVEDGERSESGAPVYRHDEPREAEPVGPELHPAYEVIEAHVERHIGPIGRVFHELASEYVHIDLLKVEPSDDRPVQTLVTSGMSSKPMTLPEGAEGVRRAELLLSLPPEWPLDKESWQDERHYWPVRLLKSLARLPHEYGTFLDVGHTIPNGDPPEPYAPGTELCCALIAGPLLAPEEFDVVEGPDGPIHFFGLVAIHADEMQVKLERGLDALADPFDKAGVSELVKPERPSALRGRKRFGLF